MLGILLQDNKNTERWKKKKTTNIEHIGIVTNLCVYMHVSYKVHIIIPRLTKDEALELILLEELQDQPY